MTSFMFITAIVFWGLFIASLVTAALFSDKIGAQGKAVTGWYEIFVFSSLGLALLSTKLLVLVFLYELMVALIGLTL